MDYDYLMSFLDRKQFGDRLAKLRNKNGISARDLSLSIGQNSHYINHIENHYSYPSMQTFFYICEYLNITPREFFDLDFDDPKQVKALADHISRINCESQKLMLILSLYLK